MPQAVGLPPYPPVLSPVPPFGSSPGRSSNACKAAPHCTHAGCALPLPLGLRLRCPLFRHGTREVSAERKKVSRDAIEVSADTREVSADTREMSADTSEVSADTNETSVDTREMSAGTREVSANTRDMFTDNRKGYVDTLEVSADTYDRCSVPRAVLERGAGGGRGLA